MCVVLSGSEVNAYPHQLSVIMGRRRSSLALKRVHPVSITRFPLSRFSPGAGLLRNPFFHRQWLRFSRGWVRKDGNLLTETGCKRKWVTRKADGKLTPLLSYCNKRSKPHVMMNMRSCLPILAYPFQGRRRSARRVRKRRGRGQIHLVNVRSRNPKR